MQFAPGVAERGEIGADGSERRIPVLAVDLDEDRTGLFRAQFEAEDRLIAGKRSGAGSNLKVVDLRRSSSPV